jgi:hypothetical protein
MTPAAGQDWARAMFETTSHDFGSVARGAKAEYAFVLVNNLAADVHITGVRASCGCTTPRIEKELVRTYEKGAIIAHLNSGSYVGHRGATLTVTFDQPAYAEVQLQVKAMVHEDILLDPASVALGSVEQGKPAESRMTVYRTGMPDWRILEVRLANPHLSGQVVEVARQDAQVWYELRVRLDATAPAGYLSDHAVLLTNDPAAPQVPILVEGQVQPEVMLSPASLFLGVMRPGETVTKQLVVRAKKPFRVTAVSADPKSFVLPAKLDGQAKMVHMVPVTFVAGAEQGKVVKTIRIQTDLSNQSVETSSYAVVTPAQ